MKKLVAALFIDIKGVFDHVSKRQLLTRILELEIEGNLMTWTDLFLTNQKVQLIIDEHHHEEKKKETRIPQGSPLSLIFYSTFISKVCDKILKTSSLVIFFSFINNLNFNATNNLVQAIVKIFEKVAKEVME